MKKKRISAPVLSLVLALLMALLLAGCGSKPQPVTPVPEEPPAPAEPVPEPAPPEPAPPEKLTPEEYRMVLAKERTDRWIEQALIDLEATPSGETSMKAQPFDLVRPGGRQTLNEAQAALYDELLAKETALEPFQYTAAEHGYPVLDDLLVASIALGEDHPMTDACCFLMDVLDGDTTTGIRSVYFMPGDARMQELTSPADMEALREELAIFDLQCQLIADAVPRDKSVYDQYRFLAIYLSLCCEYDHAGTGGTASVSPYGAIAGGTAVCEGYAKSFEQLCRKAGLWCQCVSGVSDGVAHMWNLIRLEDGTYHVDVTWSDDGVNLPGDPGWYQYFAVTQESILQHDHEITDGTVATGTREILPPSLRP